ncbi:hypothetical protein DIZ27_38925 [Streptomyces sp. NWU339]|uniref:hypothetical protein n=1 Tax=Streptomyces sp. NWU339 TaxID=2185284 RepID=UPI000D674C9B|nr:hypothetical protein [Streptomyces sp. NWU339]PWI05509.1 hypothetical protein DIZ27_38925 [Streptomyces sp. NWU339]
MSPRRISTKTPNRVASEPATVKACRGDLRTPQEQAAAADEATGLRESARFHAKASAEAPRGRR